MITQKLYIDRKEGTATIVETSKINSKVEKLGELTWACDSDKDYEKVKSYYPKAKILNL